MNTRLAIVIPAYKTEFLDAALQSIVAQTCRDFKLYIGDDHSPHAIKDIVRKYENELPVKYVRFENNLGGNDLVAQWNRCLELVEDEEWIWLFSDDDVMDRNCVASFYETLKQNPQRRLFHFNIRVIDGAGKVIKVPDPFPENLKVVDFHLQRWKSRLQSYVVEYVFSKAHFNAEQGFQKFDYAWHTDEATWTKLGFPDGIRTIENAFVNWRRSTANITSNDRDITVVKGKLEADMQFAIWAKSFYAKNDLSFTHTHKFYLVKRFTHHLFTFRAVLPEKAWKTYLKNQLNKLDCRSWYPVFWTYYNYLNRK